MKKVIQRAKKQAQQKLLEKQISLAARQAETAASQAKATELQIEALSESWWKKNILPLLALALSFFQVMGFGGSSPKRDLTQPPAVVVVVRDSELSNRADRDQNRRFPTEPFDPSTYDPVKQGKVPSFFASPLDFPPIPTEADSYLRNMLLTIQRSMESSPNPAAARLSIIANLERSKQRKLIDEQFVDSVIRYVQKIRVIRPLGLSQSGDISTKIEL